MGYQINGTSIISAHTLPDGTRMALTCTATDGSTLGLVDGVPYTTYYISVGINDMVVPHCITGEPIQCDAGGVYCDIYHDHADTIWRIMCGCQTMHEAEDVGGRYWREYLEDIINTPQRIAARAAHVARRG